MSRTTSLAEAISELVDDGDCIALEGFTHLIPYAAGHELIRQQRRSLTLVRLTPDLIYDQLIGMGVARKLIFSWAGNPGVGSLHRLRDAVENERPAPLELEEHTHAGLAARFVAGAARLPFALAPMYAGTDLVGRTDTVRSVRCPFTGAEITAVKALNPDVSIIHAQQADRDGNVLLWGIVGVQREAVLAARKAIVTVEEIVDVFEPRASSIFLPASRVTAVAVVPHGAHPSYALGYSNRDNSFYVQWDAISKDYDRFQAWAKRHIEDTADSSDYQRVLMEAS